MCPRRGESRRLETAGERAGAGWLARTAPLRRCISASPPSRSSEGTVDPEGGMDLQQLLAAAQQMQDHLMTAQQELADTEVEGTSGGGLVKARVNGQGELVELAISPAAIDPADPADTAQTVADLVLAAVHNAYRAVGDLQQEKMGPLAAGLGQPGLPEIPGLSGLFGGEPGVPGEGTEPSAPGAHGELGGPADPGGEPGPPAP